MRAMLQGLGMQEGEAIEHRWVTRAIETAQRKVEAHNFDIRKNLLEYDNVANDQRKVIYELRNEMMSAERVTPMLDEIRLDAVSAVIDAFVPPQSLEEQWNVPGLEEALKRDFALELPVRQWLDAETTLDEKGLRARIAGKLTDAYAVKKATVGAQVLEHFEKARFLFWLDQYWREHLAAMDYLRLGIHLRGYAQKDPKQEYKREAFLMFNEMLARFKHQVVSELSKVQVQTESEVAAVEEQRRRAAEKRPLQFQHEAAPAVPTQDGAAAPAPGEATGRPLEQRAPAPRAAPVTRDPPQVGRNDPCPCGSGKKYKHCHGKLS
jgi:preprotein translocase subunit SecA